jgi:hypothetical protein
LGWIPGNLRLVAFPALFQCDPRKGNTMKKNLGTVDRTVRVVVGIGLLAAGAIAGSWWALAGLVPLLTGLLGFCPAYCPLGISSCGKSGC